MSLPTVSDLTGMDVGWLTGPFVRGPARPVSLQTMDVGYLTGPYVPNGTNAAPVSAAGPDQAITLPASATLAGSATDDGVPSPLSYSWAKFSGPGSVSFVDSTNPTTSASFSVEGVYVLRLTSSDGSLTNTDDVTITVHPIPTSAVLGGTQARRRRRASRIGHRYR